MSATPADTLDALKLPDPAPAAGGADDLLSQMAGEEINRLLADAELEPEQPRNSTPAAAGRASIDAVLDSPSETADSAAVPEATISKELDQVFAKQTATGESAAPARSPVQATPADPANPESGADASDDAISADGVADLLGRLSAGESLDPPTAAQTVDAPANPGHATPDGVGDHERAALAEPHPGNTVIVAPPPAVESRLSRLVDWITLPLDPFPDDVRDLIGKIAIVTAINAVAILVYVMVFR